jgi:hypothetical protein
VVRGPLPRTTWFVFICVSYFASRRGAGALFRAYRLLPGSSRHAAWFVARAARGSSIVSTKSAFTGRRLVRDMAVCDGSVLCSLVLPLFLFYYSVLGVWDGAPDMTRGICRMPLPSWLPSPFSHFAPLITVTADASSPYLVPAVIAILPPAFG